MAVSVTHGTGSGQTGIFFTSLLPKVKLGKDLEMNYPVIKELERRTTEAELKELRKL